MMQDHRWDDGKPSGLHLQRFVGIVELGGSYDIIFAASPPKRLRIWLQGVTMEPQEV